MENKVLKQIREKTVGATEDIQFDIKEIKTKYKIPNVAFLRSSYQFYIDPVPSDEWIVDGENVIHGREIMEFIKNKKIVPKNKEEALEIAKLIFDLKYPNTKIYPEFNSKDCKKPKVIEKDGAYEVILYTAYKMGFQYSTPTKMVVKLGNGICELESSE